MEETDVVVEKRMKEGTKIKGVGEENVSKIN